MAGHATLPDAPEALDAAWLGEALGAPVRRVELLDAHSGTTGRAALRVTWDRDADRPARVFAKLPPSDPIQRRMAAETDMGRREARFYAALAREVPVRVPTPLWSGWGDEPGQYLMLLEDLAASGCRFPGASDPDPAGFAAALVDELARLHARYWDWSQHAARHPWVAGYSRSEWGPILMKAALDAFRDSSPPEFRAIAELYLERHPDFNDLLDRGVHTLVHGDCHLGNLFRDGPRPGLLDWACIAHAPGIRDVAYFLCNSLPTGLRRAEERHLVDRYRAGLETAGVAAPSAADTWRDYRRLLLSGWIAAVTTAAAGSRMQSLEVGLRAMQRSHDAVRDHDCLTLLREELG